MTDFDEYEEIRINFSDEEAASEARGQFEPVPSGIYNAFLVDGELRQCGPNSKNPGKPYWSLQFKISDGPYEGDSVWTNCMLFKPALYTLAQLMKSAGIKVEAGVTYSPTLDDFISKPYQIVVKRLGKRTNPTTGEEYDPSNDIKGIMAPGTKPVTAQKPKAAGSSAAAQPAGSSLLP